MPIVVDKQREHTHTGEEYGFAIYLKVLALKVSNLLL